MILFLYISYLKIILDKHLYLQSTDYESELMKLKNSPEEEDSNIRNLETDEERETQNQNIRMSV